MFKETKRKGFNFFRSYFDVYNELNDVDKMIFIDALLNKQFLGKNPENITGMAKFAWISQVNSIDSQVKGYEDKTGTKLPLSNPPYVGGKTTPTGQVEEKGEEKGKEIQQLYEKFADEVKIGKFDIKTEATYMRLKIKKGSLTPLVKEFNLHLIGIDRLHKSTKDFWENFTNWLNTQERIGKLSQYKK